VRFDLAGNAVSPLKVAGEDLCLEQVIGVIDDAHRLVVDNDEHGVEDLLVCDTHPVGDAK
jgi:hypothetical protein